MARAFLAGALLLLLAAPSRARACATCGCGDPTLTVMGAEPPYAGRVRLFTQLRYRWDAVGEGEARASLHEGQLDLGVSVAPDDRVVISATMPVVLRAVSWANLGHAVTVGTGDLELRSRIVLLRDRRFAPSHLLGAHVGVKLPTSIDQARADGTLLPVDAQTGSGTIDPLLGLFYAHFADPWSLFASAVVALPLAGRYDEAPGPSLRASVAVQYRLDRHVTFRAGTDVRWDAPARIGDRTDPATDQAVLFVSPDLLWSPVSDLVLVLGARIPTIQLSEQGREEGVYVQLGAVVDL
ncbi:MAG: hypothetical protein R3B82_29380 [Sandaracinaceae bacterium]